MNSILVIGAGREGKGNLGNVFRAANWNVAFLDKDKAVINALNSGEYIVEEYRVDGTYSVCVSGYSAFECDETRSCTEAALHADVIAICLYPEDIADAIDYITPCLLYRASENPSQKLTIFPCTNENRMISKIDTKLRQCIGKEALDWYEANVALRDTIVRRPVMAESSSALTLKAGVYCTMFIGTPIYADISGVPWLELCNEDIEKLKEIKVYTVNAAHVTCAFMGYRKGFPTIEEARLNEEIAVVRHGVLDEAIRALAKEYDISEEKLWEFAELPEPKEAFGDSVERVAFDPIRKLSHRDRLTGNILLCKKHGIDPAYLITAAAYGMAYDNPNDPAVERIQRLINEKGIKEAISEVTGLALENIFTQRIAEAWSLIRR